MSYRSKKSRSAAQTSKVKDATIQSVHDTIAQVIHDVANENPQDPETLLSSSCNLTTNTNQPAMTQPLQVQGTTREVDDDDLSNQRYATRQSLLARSLSQPDISDTPRQPRASRKRRSLLVQEPTPGVDAEEVHASETQENDAGEDHQQHIGERQILSALPSQPVPVGSRQPRPSTRQTLWDQDSDEEPVQPEISQIRPSKRPKEDHQQNIGERQILSALPSQSVPVGSRQPRPSTRQTLWDQDSDEEPVQPEISQIRPSKRPKWSDDIEFDEMEEVEMRGLDGRRGKKGGRILPRHVWSLQPGVKFVVPFNEFDQPVRKGGHIFVRFLGDIAKNGEICPIGELNWRKVDKSCKANIIALVRDKFVLPDHADIDKDILKRVGNSWRMYRYELKMQYKKPDKTKEQVAGVVPKGIPPSQWKKLVQYWFSDQSKLLSTRGREARAALSHLHTSGSKSFAQMRDEFEKAHGREPGPVEWFVQTHQRKDGTYVDNSSKEFLDAASARISQKAPTPSSSKCVAVENQVFNELMYSDDERYQRPLGYGFGVNRDKVFGVGAELRKKGYLRSGISAEAVNIRNRMTGVGAEPKRSGCMKSDTSAEVERLRFSVAAMSETHELMQSQLQMQSQQLKMQAQQLQMQSQQMEGLQFQLQQVTSLLTRFGVMLNNPSINTASRGAKHHGVSFAKSQVPEAALESSDDESQSSEWDSD